MSATPFEPPHNQPEPDVTLGELVPTALIGGVAGGIFANIPLVNFTLCCFCLPIQLGAGVGVGLFLQQNDGVKLTTGDAALSGAIAGATAGLLSGLISMGFRLLMGNQVEAMTEAIEQLPMEPEVKQIALDVLSGMGGTGGLWFDLAMMPVSMAVMGAFGVLGGMLTLHLFYSDRRLT